MSTPDDDWDEGIPTKSVSAATETIGGNSSVSVAGATDNETSFGLTGVVEIDSGMGVVGGGLALLLSVRAV